MSRPSVYLNEICQEILDCLNCTVSPSTVCRLLKRCEVTRKKIRQVAQQRCESLRGSFMAQTFLFERKMFVWIVETGSDARNHIRKYGYALRGERATTHRFLSRGKRINAIAAISSEGLLAFELKDHTVTGKSFYYFERGSLIPNMQPFNGENPHSIAVMDNCSIHHVSEVKQLFRNAGILLLYLAPYIPDLNPIEEAFSYIKSYLRKHDELLQCIPDHLHVMQTAFESITKEHCSSWITHSGYIY